MNTYGPMYLHPFPVEIFKNSIYSSERCFLLGGGCTQNGLNLAVKRGSIEMAALIGQF